MHKHVAGSRDYSDGEREVKALRAFNKLKSKHIVRGIGAYIQDSTFCIIMEWADRGDLHHVWEKNPEPHLTVSPIEVAEVLTQFHGLADALNKMHEITVTPASNTTRLSIISKSPASKNGALNPTIDSGSSQFGLSTIAEASYQAEKMGDGGNSFTYEYPSINVTAATSTPMPHLVENWRHGDIKPENILSFDSDCSIVGLLKLADLGRAKQKKDVTGLRKVATSEKYSTPEYDGPEVWVGADKGRSRLVNIWSFGCVPDIHCIVTPMGIIQSPYSFRY